MTTDGKGGEAYSKQHPDSSGLRSSSQQPPVDIPARGLPLCGAEPIAPPGQEAWSSALPSLDIKTMGSTSVDPILWPCSVQLLSTAPNLTPPGSLATDAWRRGAQLTIHPGRESCQQPSTTGEHWLRPRTTRETEQPQSLQPTPAALSLQPCPPAEQQPCGLVRAGSPASDPVQ